MKIKVNINYLKNLGLKNLGEWIINVNGGYHKLQNLLRKLFWFIKKQNLQNIRNKVSGSTLVRKFQMEKLRISKET